MRRRRLVAVVGIAAALAAAAVVVVRAERSNRDPSAKPRRSTIAVQVGGATLAEVPIESQGRAGKVQRLLPAASTVRDGRVRYRYIVDRRATAERIRRASGARVQAVARVGATAIAAPAFQQAQRNSCESAALSILLAANGIRVDQRLLQRELPRSGPLDPLETAADRVWGDPDLGYVGRADGTGPAGGFGVYPGPVRALARRHGLKAADLTGRDPAAVYERLREGRAVMVWVGLGEGPYAQWTSESGRNIEVNLNEHTVVLDGIRGDGSVSVSNPLEGTREVWSSASFETMWERLGRRAIS